MSRVFNFAAGPAALPESVLLKAQHELLDWNKTGVSIMEIGHRTTSFQDLLTGLENKLRILMNIPDNYKVLFLSGGAQGHFSFIPMNLCGKNQKVDYVVSGSWSERAAKYAKRYADVNIVTTGTIESIAPVNEWKLTPDAAYVYYCQNESISGFQLKNFPDTNGVPLIGDFTSSLLSEPIELSKYGLIFASAQKNLGIAGITLLIIRDDLLNQSQDVTPEIFNYKTQAENDSLLNTIPTTAIYMMDLVVDWINEQGGLDGMAVINKRKANKLYDCIDNSNGFYTNPVANEYRSAMNIPFILPSEELLKKFLTEATAEKLAYLKGHKSVGGARASLYNAVSEEAVDALIKFMLKFQAQNS